MRKFLVNIFIQKKKLDLNYLYKMTSLFLIELKIRIGKKRITGGFNCYALNLIYQDL